jgi:hypothetical protein
MKRIPPFIWQQLQLAYRLTFKPNLDSAIYLNRTRLNIATLTMLALDAIYAMLWLWVFNEAASPVGFLLVAAGCAGLAFLNLQWRFIPKISPLAVVVFCLWLNMPVLALYIYFIDASPVQALANAIVLLMLYMHIQDWRSSLLGVILAAVLTPTLYWWTTGAWPAWPPILQIILFCSALAGAVVVAASSANITKMRQRYAQKVLQVTQMQLRPALQLQTELVGNMRYEARNILQDERQRLELDQLAQDLQTHITQLQRDVAQLVQAGVHQLGDLETIGLLRSSDILAMVRHDLMVNHHFAADYLDAALVPNLQDDVVIEANGAEISQALGALIASMLHAAAQSPEQQPGQQDAVSPPVFIIHCWKQAQRGKLRIGLPSLMQAKKTKKWGAIARHNTGDLPPFSSYIFRLFHISWQVHARFDNGSPADITLSYPLPSHPSA